MSKVQSQASKTVSKLSAAFMDQPWTDKMFYANYIAQTYYYIVHTTKLLQAAKDAATDPELAECIAHHLAEERGHEKWAQNDLKALGFDLKDFPESAVIKQMYGDIYTGIQKSGPAAIFGYAIALEGLSAKVCPMLAPTLHASYGKKAATFITSHAKIDQEHAAESFSILKFFDEAGLRVIADHIVLTEKTYLRFLEGLPKSRHKSA